MSDTTAGVSALYLEALTRPAGSYDTERASQLSGVPDRSLVRWASRGWIEADWHGRDWPWSYRDLVFVRLLAFLLARGMHNDRAVFHVNRLREKLTAVEGTHTFTADNLTVLVDDEDRDPLTHQGVFLDVRTALGVFDLSTLRPLREFRGREQKSEKRWRDYRGPDLRTPSPHTYISPWVMSGDPCIADTRIQTSAVWALHENHGLAPRDIRGLYPDLTAAEIRDAIQLESTLRRVDTVAA